jgi:hypothetical protein
VQRRSTRDAHSLGARGAAAASHSRREPGLTSSLRGAWPACETCNYLRDGGASMLLTSCTPQSCDAMSNVSGKFLLGP